MINWPAARRTLLLFCLLLGCSGCGKSPTEAPIEVEQSTISLTCNPASSGQNEVISISVVIKNNTNQVRVFGLDMAFDSRMFQFQEVRKGTLTGNWGEVDGNAVAAGTLRIGGFAGGGSAVPAKSEGSLAEIRLKVTGGGYSNGQQSQVCIKQYTDDLAGFQPSSACSTFTLKK
jgi:Cohesin domain